MKVVVEIFVHMMWLLFTLVANILPVFDAYVEFNPAIPKPLARLLWWLLRLWIWSVIAAIVYVANHY